MSTGTKTTLDEWVFPAADDEPDEDEWLECGHSPEHADENGHCVTCNLSGAVEDARDGKADITADSAATSPFDGVHR